MRVGVFDSGIGGLSVVKSLLEEQLFEEIIYFGDTARVPYGSKDKSTIIRYAIEAVDFFKNFEIDLLIVACNSVSAYALSEMNESSNCPVIGVVEAGVLATANAMKHKEAHILLIGTHATVASGAYERGLQALAFKSVESLATPLFVPLVEEEIQDKKILNATLEYYFKESKKPDALILGCTHFPFLSEELQAYFGESTLLIHSGDAIVEYLHKHFTFKKKFSDPKMRFYASQNPDALREIAKRWLYA